MIVLIKYMFLDWVIIGWWHVMAWISKPPVKWQTGDKGDVVYVSGWNEHWYWGKKVLDKLNSLGYRIRICNEVENLRGLAPVSKSAEILAEYLERDKLTDVILIGHSKGGLIGYYLMDNLESNKRIAKMIAIASPFGGTVWAEARVFSLGEMRRSGELAKKWGVKKDSIASLQNDIEEKRKSISIYPTFDPSVIPHSASYLDGGENIELPVIGHAWIMRTNELVSEIEKIVS